MDKFLFSLIDNTVKVLIVSRTQMKNGVCVGGINIDTCELIRLHNDRGGNLSCDAPYQIGEIWSMVVENPWNPRPEPHTEDRSVTPKSLVENIGISGVVEYINNNIDGLNVAVGDLTKVFDGSLQVSGNKCYVGEENVPGFSTQFWIADSPLYHRVCFDKDFYYYKGLLIRFVGFQQIVDVIPQGTVIRLSLANWWDNGCGEERCYLQLSGWYKA